MSELNQPSTQPGSTGSNNALALLLTGVVVGILAVITISLISTSKLSQQNVGQISTYPSPTLDPTENCKTYISTSHGFSIKYPAELSDYTNTTDEFLYIHYPGESDVPFFEIRVYETKLSPEEWWNQVGKNQYPIKISNTAFNRTAFFDKDDPRREIKGVEMIGQRKSPGGATLPTRLFLVPKDDFLLVIFGETQGYEKNSNTKDIAGCDQILSTFRFLDQAPSVLTIAEPCDLSNDGQCDKTDFALFQKSLGKKRGDTDYNPLADADADGVVTPDDAMMLKFSFPISLPYNTVTPTPNSKQVVCTQDVKQCPDGSYISRKSPTCEFAQCP